jgi:hypothetical protein
LVRAPVAPAALAALALHDPVLPEREHPNADPNAVVGDHADRSASKPVVVVAAPKSLSRR